MVKGTEYFKQAIDLEPNHHAAYYYLSLALIGKSRYKDAIKEIEKVAEFSGQSPEYLGLLSLSYSFAGKKSDAREFLERLKELDKNRFVSSIGFIYAYLGLGDQKMVMEYLQKSFESRDFPNLPWLTRLEIFHNLRTDPRFEEITRKMNFT